MVPRKGDNWINFSFLHRVQSFAYGLGLVRFNLSGCGSWVSFFVCINSVGDWFKWCLPFWMCLFPKWFGSEVRQHLRLIKLISLSHWSHFTSYISCFWGFLFLGFRFRCFFWFRRFFCRGLFFIALRSGASASASECCTCLQKKPRTALLGVAESRSESASQPHLTTPIESPSWSPPSWWSSQLSSPSSSPPSSPPPFRYAPQRARSLLSLLALDFKEGLASWVWHVPVSC